MALRAAALSRRGAVARSARVSEHRDAPDHRTCGGYERFSRAPPSVRTRRARRRCYLPEIGGYGLLVLAVEGDLVSAVTWFGDRRLFPHFGLPSTPVGIDLE